MRSICLTKDFIFLLILFFIKSVISENENSITVRIKNGEIVGKTKTYETKSFNEFLGIPYAQPPVGSLRFKKPVPLTPWSEPVQAVDWPKPCYQFHPFPEKFKNLDFSEDCLYLNVWSALNASQSATEELRPVLFWIHGGALIFGSSVEEYYSGHILSVFGDVVVVTINYRLNTFGFLYTGTGDAPGNVGLWDQNLALEWVNDNIKYFGGDPNRVTVFGESAGSWSTSLHILSPASRHLFQNSIMMSGAAINRMAGDEPQNVLKNWLTGAQAIGCTDTESDGKFTEKIIDCLKAAPADKLAAIPLLPETTTGLVGWMSQVVIDRDFLPDRPLKMLEQGDFKRNVNLMIGTAEDEGSFVLGYYVDQVKYAKVSPPKITFSEAYSELSRISSTLVSTKPIDGESVSKLYFTGLSDSNSPDLLRRTIGIAVGDFLLGCPTFQFARTLFESDKNSKVFQYYYTSKLGEPKLLCSEWMGACHVDDIFPVFGVPFYQKSKFVDQERDISHQMIKIFTDFAKTGKPPAQHGAQWSKYYDLNGSTIAPYFEISHKERETTNFGIGLKTNECQYLWKPYIDLQ